MKLIPILLLATFGLSACQTTTNITFDASYDDTKWCIEEDGIWYCEEDWKHEDPFDDIEDPDFSDVKPDPNYDPADHTIKNHNIVCETLPNGRESCKAVLK